jgi:ATP-binding cassette, subfamily F, member 3
MSSQNLLQMQNGHKAYGLQVLFDDAVFAINEGEHVGVIGPNGAGKSTLFKVLLNPDELDSGKIIRSQALRLGYLSQHDEWKEGETGNDYLERVCTIPVWQAKATGRSLQVSEETFAKPILSLSGGYRMRIKLIGLLGTDPNLMLLDEPTNYLDLETTLLLESFLQSYEGAFLLISHDREILRRTTDHTLEVESGEIIKYNGHIDDYFEQKELLRSQLEAQAQGQALKRKAVMDFVNRFGAKATKAKQAQSRLKMLAKMETIEFKPIPIKASIQIPPPPHVGKTILKLTDAQFGYAKSGDKKVVLENVNLEIRKGDHVAVIGLNGAGKSTLLKGLAGTLEPIKGTREVGYEVKIAIFNQHVVEVLNPEHTIYQSLESTTNSMVTPQDIKNMAGSLLFSSDQIEKKIKVLSGGEKSRVALGRILLQKVPCLLLDEPTNHLDFQTVEALTQALTKYAGTLIVVSHDRNFIRRVGTKILEVSAGEVDVYPGTYDEYVWSLQQRLANEDVVESKQKSKVKSAPQPAKPQGQNSAPIASPGNTLERKESARQLRQSQKRIEQVQNQIEKLEIRNTELNEKIVGETPANSYDMIKELSDNAQKIEQLEAEWMKLADEIAALTPK